jgi:hypothetical protein
MALSDAQLDVLLADLLPRTGWRRSDRGNLTRGSPSGARLTVFERHSDWSAWSMLIGRCIRSSPRLYRTEAEAVDAMWAEANGGR